VARFDFDMRSDAGPDAIRAALLDFTDHRPELWPGLPRDQYEVYAVGDTWAEIREGYRGPIWNRERYDWSVPGRVEFTALDSGFAKAGKRVVMDIEAAQGGGSRVRVIWEGVGKGLFGRLFIGLMALTRGFFIRRSIQLGLDRIAVHEDVAGTG
jgi:hypothetical protein